MSEYKTWLELEVVVDYDFQPEEEKVLYPNDKAYPGCPAHVTINTICIVSGGIDHPINISDELESRVVEDLEAEIMFCENEPPEEL